MSHVDREIRKLAAELYDEAVAKGVRFTVAELVEELTELLRARLAESALDNLIQQAASAAIEKVDQARTRPQPQASLLDGLDQPVSIGGGSRVARRAMRNDDWSVHLAHVSENASRVNASAAKEYARHAALGPYLAAGMDTEAAIAAWQAEHPGEVLP